MPPLMLLALLTVSFGCFLSFAWGLYNHFRVERPVPLAMRGLSLLSAATFGGYVARLWTALTDQSAVCVATVLFVASLALFWWAIRATRRDPPFVAHSSAGLSRLHVTGPYRVIRHPFYAAYILFWLGVAVAAGPLLWAPTLMLCIWYVLTARHEERALQSGALETDYRTYRARTGMLFPRYQGRGIAPHPASLTAADQAVTLSLN